MRSRSILPHDSHLMCSSNHHERVDTRALHRIKSLSIIRLISLALLLAVSVTACSSGKTKPRAMGIGLRSGYIEDNSDIQGKDGEQYVVGRENRAVNYETTPRFPVFIQFDEDLFSNWSYGETVLDYAPMRKEDSPPALKEGYYYDTIIRENTADFNLDSSKTKITEFRSTYPEYAPQIDAATNPTISADYEIKTVSLGYQIGLFLPLSERHRILTIGMGIGVSYANGTLNINLCDPFHISLEKIDGEAIDYNQGFCQNKKYLVSQTISTFGTGLNGKVIMYAYVGEDFEFSFLQLNSIYMADLIAEENDFKPKFFPLYLDVYSVAYRF